MSSRPRGPNGESTSAAVGGSDVPGVSQSGHSARRGNGASSTGPLPVHPGGGGERYDWRSSKYNRSTPGATGSENSSKAVGQPPRPTTPPSPTALSPSHTAMPPSPTSRLHFPASMAHSSTGPLPSRFNGPGSNQHDPRSRPGDMDLKNKSMLGVGSAIPPRSLESPTYSSGELSSGELRVEVSGREGGLVVWRHGGLGLFPFLNTL